jgi:hypothetical protein
MVKILARIAENILRARQFVKKILFEYQAPTRDLEA